MVGCVLMASGAGRRFGSNKLLSAVEGVPPPRRAMAALAPAGFGRLVVCSPYPEVLSAGAEYGFRPPGNPGAGGGDRRPPPPRGAAPGGGGGGRGPPPGTPGGRGRASPPPSAWAWPPWTGWTGPCSPSVTSPG